MALLLVVLILAAILSIATGIFNVVFGELRIAGEISDSFQALYAADEGMERMLYCDRVSDSGCAPCPGAGSCSYGPVLTLLANGACHTVRLSRTGRDTTVTSTGEYRCGGTTLAVRRALQSTYTRD